MAAESDRAKERANRSSGTRPVVREPSRSSSRNRASSSRHSLEEVKARESRSLDDELEYFTVETVCLNCKKKLTAQVVELHGKLTCPRCETVMHMGPDGKWHKGPPPTFIVKAPKLTRWHRLCYRYPFLRSRTVHIAAGALILVAIGVAYWFLSPPSVQLPSQLAYRAHHVCNFVLLNERRKFLQCVASGTSSGARDWYETLRGSIEASEAENYAAQIGEVKILFENAQEGLAQVRVQIRFLSKDPRQTEQELELETVLVWTHTGQGWLLDGTETLNRLKS